MKIRFWGVRGSIPTPPTSDQIKEKIRKFAQRIVEEKISDQHKIDTLIDTLTPVETGLIGGNTSCVEVRADNKLIILDMGSGMKNLGNYIVKHDQNTNGLEIHIFISHTHWDHILGFPFFAPAFFPNNKIFFYGGHPNIKEHLETQQVFRFFPVALHHMKAKKEFIQLKRRTSLEIGNVTVKNYPLYHPGGSFGYRVECGGKSLVYATDSEYKDLSKENTKKHLEFFKNADLLIFDAQYTFEEAIHKEDWGHSSALVGIDFSIQANVKRMALFHHEPERDDYEIDEILQKSINYKKINYPDADLKILLATEGLEIEL
ncbi:MAG: MBL fold metallo-hydrolase [Candidatus Marinimicrobia bacterium]|jgi:phosphoribosyl 1,2-cyclic phosphodiesterase|nr:MBL fold metallo-hydrolase [Candidatus Neomarinimicrobiota bacterium]